MDIQVFTQSSIRIEGDGKVIYVDPFRLRENKNDADYIFLTHDHYDHFSPEDIDKCRKSDTVFAAPESMAENLSNAGVDEGAIRLLDVGVFTDVDGLDVQTVAAYNPMKSFHPKKNGWLGYIIMLEGKKIYISGDMDATKEAKQVKCDIALIPIGGTYTMNYREAAGLINEIHPRISIPTHYGTIVGKETDAEKFAELVEDDIEVKIIKQY